LPPGSGHPVECRPIHAVIFKFWIEGGDPWHVHNPANALPEQHAECDTIAQLHVRITVEISRRHPCVPSSFRRKPLLTDHMTSLVFVARPRREFTSLIGPAFCTNPKGGSPGLSAAAERAGFLVASSDYPINGVETAAGAFARRHYRIVPNARSASQKVA